MPHDDRHRQWRRIGVRLLMVIVPLVVASCGTSSQQRLESSEVQRDWTGLSEGKEVARQAAIAWSGDKLFTYGGYDGSAANLSVALDGNIYDPVSGSWETIPSPPGDPIVGPQAAYADGRIILLGTRCPPGAIRFDEAEATCDSGAGAGLWFDISEKEWSSIELPDWLSGPIELLLSPASTLEFRGDTESYLYFASDRLIARFDLNSQRFEMLYDASPGLLESCRTTSSVVGLRSPVGGVEDRGLETVIVDVESGEAQIIDAPVQESDINTVGCGASAAHLYINNDEPDYLHVGTFELSDAQWREVDGWPDDLGVPLRTGTASGVELAWAGVNSSDSVRVIAADSNGWHETNQQPPKLGIPYTVIDVDDGVVLQAGDSPLQHLSIEQ